MEEKNKLINRLDEIKEVRKQKKIVDKELRQERKKQKEETKRIKKENKEDIKALKKAKKYDEIYEKYGSEIFIKNTPQRYRSKNAKQLFKEGRYTDIYEKHGEKQYDKFLYKMMAREVYNETGSRPKSILNRVKNAVLHRIAPVALSFLFITPPTMGTTIGVMMDNAKRENGIMFSEEIEKYNENIDEYAEKIRAMNLTDVQLFMKLMDDMWKQIDGYKYPDEPDLAGYFRLTLQRENGGVCRHFADDITAKLNAINPEYNARNLVVYISDNDYNFANIERKIIESNETVVENNDENKNEEKGTSFDDIATKIIGNHMVTAVDIPDKDITLILDPTNPGIGVFVDGKIHMFSTENGRGLSLKTIGQLFQGAEDFTDITLKSLRSFKHSNYSLEELREIYGTEAQNEALTYLASIDEKNNSKEDDFIPKFVVNEEKAIQETMSKTNDSITKNVDELDK